MSNSDVEYKRNLTWLSTQHHFEHHACMKSEESTKDSNNDKEALTTREQLEVLQHKVLVC